jgi:hypothetical protein
VYIRFRGNVYTESLSSNDRGVHIYNVPGGKFSILGGHSIGHSKQNVYMYICPIPNGFRDRTFSLYTHIHTHANTRSRSHSLALSLSVSVCVWLYSPTDLGRFFSFLILYRVGRTPWTGDQPVARLLPTHRTTRTE